MITKSIFTIILAVMVSATSVYASSKDQCYQAADLLGTMAESRDEGFPPANAMRNLLMMGFPSKTATEMVMYVYFVMSDENPTEIKSDFMNKCLGDKT